MQLHAPVRQLKAGSDAHSPLVLRARNNRSSQLEDAGIAL